jgi:G3E family GTPase
VSRHLDEAERDAERVSEAIEQVAMADTILLNKTDLVRASDARVRCAWLVGRAAGGVRGGTRRTHPGMHRRCAPHNAHAHEHATQVSPEFLSDLTARLRRVNALAPITRTSRSQVRGVDGSVACVAACARGVWCARGACVGMHHQHAHTHVATA